MANSLASVTFWSAFCLLLYIYAGYPVLARVLALKGRRERLPEAACGTPFVSIVVSTRDDSSAVLQRINNCLAQNYPPERFEILIGCDDRPDTFDTIVSQRLPQTAVVGFPRVGL